MPVALARFVGIATVAVLALVPARAAEKIPLPKPRPAVPGQVKDSQIKEPLTFREAAGTEVTVTDVTRAPSPCRLRLDAIAIVNPMPRLVGPSACGGRDMVELLYVVLSDKTRIEIMPGPLLRCEMAEAFSMWVREEVVPRASKIGAALRAVETYDDYNCRGRNRIAGARMSEHGKGNAIDVRSLIMADKTMIEPTDMYASKALRDGLRESACARFTTVLGPQSDGFHESHIHLDLAERRHAGYQYCKWAVLEPPTSTVVYVELEGGDEMVPLPPSRPLLVRLIPRWPRGKPSP